jgi:adenosylcobinamide-phosphate synthase
VLVIAGAACGAGVLIHDLAYSPRGARGIEVAAIVFLVFQRAPFDNARSAARKLAEADYTSARAIVEATATEFCGGVIGVTFWYLALGLPGLCLYRAVHVTASRLAPRGPFGHGARAVNAMLGAIPAPFAGAILSIAALFVPHANPLRAFGTMLRDFRKHASPDASFTMAAVAGAFGLALAGGPWIGDGRARVTAQDVRNTAYLYAVACLIHAGILALALSAYSPI